MIKSKKDYDYYIRCDEYARFKKKATIIDKLLAGDAWKFNVLLRKSEYNINCRKGFLKKILELYYRMRMKRISHKTNWYISPNCFGPGLCVAHYGTVIVNEKASFGENVRIHAMVNIGAHNGGVPKGGNNIYIGPGAVIFGNITIGNNICIGANSVVNKSFLEDNITIAGVPAKIVAQHGCEDIVVNSTIIVSGDKND